MKRIGFPAIARASRSPSASVGGDAGVGVVVGDLAVEERRRLRRRQQAVVLQGVEREGPRLVRVQHDGGAGEAVDRRVDAVRRALDRARALDRPAVVVVDHEVARARLRPVPAERQDQVAALLSRHLHRQVVVDAFLELVQDREAVRGGEMDARLGEGVGTS
jgi:hypothetical protein